MESTYTYNALDGCREVIKSLFSDQVLIPSTYITFGILIIVLVVYLVRKIVGWLIYFKRTTKEERREHREARRKRVLWRSKE